MRPSDDGSDAPGELITVSSRASSFLPNALPPAIAYDAALVDRLSSAMLAIGNLDAIVRQLNNPYLLLRPFQLREAVASSQIEGTQTDLRELLMFQAAEQSDDAPSDVREVRNYVSALAYGVSQPAERPVSVSLIKEMHRLLLEGVRGQEQQPGALRKGLVWIAGDGRSIEEARFVPPPPTSVPGLLDDLARFMNEDTSVPALIRLALAHYQFETIHPFSDGNGRVGRLLIPLLLVRWGVMTQPALYVSDFFNANRDLYVDGLWNVSRFGQWREWIDLFVLALNAQATDAYRRGDALLQLLAEYRDRYQRGRTSAALLTVIDRLFESPAITIPSIERSLNVSFPTASKWVTTLVEDGVLQEATNRPRNRVFIAREVFDILNARPFFVGGEASA